MLMRILIALFCAASCVTQASACQDFFSSAYKNHKKLVARRIVANLPQEVRIGNGYQHQVQYLTGETKIAKWILAGNTPIPDREGKLVDLNDNPNFEPIPRRVLISDGTMQRAVTGVDWSEGSPLDQRLRLIVRSSPHIANEPDPEIKLQKIKVLARSLMPNVPDSAHDGSAQLPWDLQLDKDKIFQPTVRWDTGRIHVIASDHRVLVAPLEHYIDRGHGYCLQQSLFAHLLLAYFGIKSRVVNGAVAADIQTFFGHTWVELEDKRVWDVSLDLLMPVRRHGEYIDEGNLSILEKLIDKDWVQLPGSVVVLANREESPGWRFPKNHFLALSLDPDSNETKVRLEKDAPQENDSQRQHWWQKLLDALGNLSHHLDLRNLNHIEQACDDYIADLRNDERRNIRTMTLLLKMKPPAKDRVLQLIFLTRLILAMNNDEASNFYSFELLHHLAADHHLLLERSVASLFLSLRGKRFASFERPPHSILEKLNFQTVPRLFHQDLISALSEIYLRKSAYFDHEIERNKDLITKIQLGLLNKQNI